jgi:hypothetical protein
MADSVFEAKKREFEKQYGKIKYEKMAKEVKNLIKDNTKVMERIMEMRGPIFDVNSIFDYFRNYNREMTTKNEEFSIKKDDKKVVCSWGFDQKMISAAENMLTKRWNETVEMGKKLTEAVIQLTKNEKEAKKSPTLPVDSWLHAKGKDLAIKADQKGGISYVKESLETDPVINAELIFHLIFTTLKEELKVIYTLTCLFGDKPNLDDTYRKVSDVLRDFHIKIFGPS